MLMIEAAAILTRIWPRQRRSCLSSACKPDAKQHCCLRAEPVVCSNLLVDVQSVEGMKMLCYELMGAANNGVSDSTLAHYGAQANALTLVLTEKVEQVSHRTQSPCDTVIAAMTGPPQKNRRHFCRWTTQASSPTFWNF